jgi:hypothetical protein
MAVAFRGHIHGAQGPHHGLQPLLCAPLSTACTEARGRELHGTPAWAWLLAHGLEEPVDTR